MTNDDMIRMANQIADFFGPYPQDEALAGVSGHIRDFWEPRMKQALAAHVATGGAGLQPLVMEAAKALHRSD